MDVLLGILATVLVASLVYLFQRRHSQKDLATIEGSLSSTQRKIDRINESLLAFNQTIDVMLERASRVVAKLDLLPDEIAKLVSESEKIGVVRDSLEENMRHFKSFVQTVEAIREHGVEILTRDQDHPDLKENVVILFAKQSLWEKIGENIASAAGGAVTGYTVAKQMAADGDFVIEGESSFESALMNKLDSIESELASLRARSSW